MGEDKKKEAPPATGIPRMLVFVLVWTALMFARDFLLPAPPSKRAANSTTTTTTTPAAPETPPMTTTTKKPSRAAAVVGGGEDEEFADVVPVPKKEPVPPNDLKPQVPLTPRSATAHSVLVKLCTS